MKDIGVKCHSES